MRGKKGKCEWKDRNLVREREWDSAGKLVREQKYEAGNVGQGWEVKCECNSGTEIVK